jgi:hypothetical protein
MDFDPRDHDARERDHVTDGHDVERDHERHASAHTAGQEDDWSHLKTPVRDHDDRAPSPGRRPGTSSRGDDDGGRERDDLPWPDRDREAREFDLHEPFTRDLNLPSGPDRELVRIGGREYALRGSETRTLATVGAFRVVSSRDLRDQYDRPLDPRSGDLRHLREQGLVETVRVPGSREYAIALARGGRSLVEHYRDRDTGGRQTFWKGVKRERELEHDLQVYRAYERAADRLGERGARIERVVLDHELKREYQTWLHERDREGSNYDGHPDRTDEEIRSWASEHDLPYFDDEVHFPDLRIEYRDQEGREDHEDIEVTTEHYRGAHAASVARSGFSCYRGSSLRIGASSGGRRGGGRTDIGLAEELLD